MHAMMDPDQILEHARAAEAAGAHRFCMVTQGQGLSKRDFEKILAGARLVAEHTNLKRCVSIGHMSAARARRSRKPASSASTTTSRPRELLPRGLDHGPLRGTPADDRRGARGGPRDLRGRHPQPGRVERAARRDGVPARRGEPDLRADQPAEPAPGHEVRRPRADGPVGGRQVGRDLPAHHPRRPVPPLRRPQREPRRRRVPAARREGRPQRGDDGQLPHDARLGAGVGPRDVRGARAERGAPGRQRRQPAARQPLRLARGRDAADAGRRADRLAAGGELLEPGDTASPQEEDLGAAAAGWRAERIPGAGPGGPRAGRSEAA